MVGVRMREEEFIIKFYSCDDEEQFLKDIYHNLNCLQQENQQLKEQLLVIQDNEETFRLEMEDITKALRLDKGTLFDDVKVYARSLKDNLKLLKKENYELKKKLEESKKNNNKLLIYNANIKFNSKRFIKYLEDEKDRLIKETSHYYIDSFDRQHAVNETIYDEVDIILQKYKEIRGISDEKIKN